VNRWWFFFAVALTSGCVTSRNPPLPETSTRQSPEPSLTEPSGATKLRDANIVYVCLTKTPSPQNDASWRLIEEMLRSPGAASLGWSQISFAYQPLFDEWQARRLPARRLLDRVAPSHGAEWLQRALESNVSQVALGAPSELLRKIQQGKALTAEERALIPHEFRLRAEALDNFADRIASSPRLRRENLANLFRAHVVAEQIVAANIVRFFGVHSGTRLFVILPDDIVLDASEIAAFVAQKLELRQMILDRSKPARPNHPRLLAGRG
jgi:hypothetical protein